VIKKPQYRGRQGSNIGCSAIGKNGVRIVNYATSKKVPCSLIAAFVNTPGPLLIEKRTTR
jgi:hypothetical protein